MTSMPPCTWATTCMSTRAVATLRPTPSSWAACRCPPPRSSRWPTTAQRHAQYKTDPDLQALHAAAPMIAVWDDHEIANDTWATGAENHQSATEGSFAARKAAALQAYHEWMPTRNAQPDLIYRSFNFGNLLALHMLDTRVVGRDEPADYTRFFTASGFDAAGFTAAVGAPAANSWAARRRNGCSSRWPHPPPPGRCWASRC
jgi:hypothetical protein